MPDSSTVWPVRVRVRVAAHSVVGLLLGVAIVVTVVHGEVTAAAASAAALVFFLEARHTEAMVARAQHTTQQHAVRAAQAQVVAEQVRVRAEQTLDLVVATATANLPQDTADELILTVLAYRENLDHPPTPGATHDDPSRP
ncbi:hypothetical protein RHODO2019_18070 (plasmid) [Rhodococcus antarcticus]|uniref:ANTAR domain-containing protein n=1 Tax=Rhodococcus antarcticus TaxID=2987751 RepID=A0ABY6P5H8_9NOCA|nr:hypothetical protein [Rhodococcus antarcticus]UZJ26900.1 hypothetical protein RHODO2019_18070 [Rhodococcus antarcticus]